MRKQYEFRLSGRLSAGAVAAVRDFGDLRIVPARHETVLYGVVTDQTNLSGILIFLENMGLRVMSVHQLCEENDRTGSRS